MRAVWTGSVTFGLVNVPVKAYGATEDHDLSFHQVHDKDGGRIRYERRCEVCGEKVEYKHIDKAFEEDGDTVVITDEDFDSLPEANNDEIEVVQFVPADQIDPLMMEKSYYLAPEGKTPKSYLLLRQTLLDSELIAVVRFALRQKTRLGVLRVVNKVIVLQGLMWADEVRELDFDDEFKGTKSRAKIGEKELKLSKQLVESYASDFTPEEFEDDYQAELRKLVDAKFEEGETLDTEATFGSDGSEGSGDSDGSGDDNDNVVDLMAALKASLDKRDGGGKSGSGKKGKSA